MEFKGLLLVGFAVDNYVCVMVVQDMRSKAAFIFTALSSLVIRTSSQIVNAGTFIGWVNFGMGRPCLAFLEVS